MQLHHPTVLHELAALEASWLVISFAPVSRLQKWVPHFQAGFLEPYYEEQKLAAPANPFSRTHFLADPDLSVYHAYGLGRNSLVKVYGPGIIWKYVRFTLQGKPIKRPAEDPLQRGGNFVINRAGRLTLAHTGHDQHDRPPVGKIITALKLEI